MRNLKFVSSLRSREEKTPRIWLTSLFLVSAVVMILSPLQVKASPAFVQYSELSQYDSAVLPNFDLIVEKCGSSPFLTRKLLVNQADWEQRRRTSMQAANWGLIFSFTSPNPNRFYYISHLMLELPTDPKQLVKCMEHVNSIHANWDWNEGRRTSKTGPYLIGMSHEEFNRIKYDYYTKHLSESTCYQFELNGRISDSLYERKDGKMADTLFGLVDRVDTNAQKNTGRATIIDIGRACLFHRDSALLASPEPIPVQLNALKEVAVSFEGN